MKIIRLNESLLTLPDCWDDLKYRQKLFVFSLLMKLYAREISPEVVRLKMLIYFTGYRPSTFFWSKTGIQIRFYFLLIRTIITNIPFLLKYGWKEYTSFLSLWKDAYKPESQDRKQREIINFNLLKLSEQLDFAFHVEDMQIIPNHKFKKNPIPFIRICNRKYQGKKFDLDITAKTNISAREFADAYDLFAAIGKMPSDEEKEECINQLCAILYPKLENHKENLVSGHIKNMEKVNPILKFGIVFWFNGIIDFYTTHPIYSILFKKNQEPDSSKIRLGMNEVVLFLQKEGYGNPDDMNLNDYFDSQIKSLKDSVNMALAKGAKIEEIARETGIGISIINQLT
ncbi:MAG: hypothetical protein FWF54_03235 [Candidatus Azobacteroides sp.]|nr:hypothetical protein [Candidatus Azobacteroides sp.]